MNYLSALSNTSFYSPISFHAGYGNYSGQSDTFGGLVGTERQSDTPGQIGTAAQDPAFRQIGISGQNEIPGQLRIPGLDAAQNARTSPISGQPDTDTYECETCKNRKYQDGSNDPGVSFKTPTRLSPERAAFAIRAHEAEHVAHARLKAQKEDQEIISQSVSYRTSICPECGRVYVSGGTTRTTFRSTPVVEEEPVKKGQYVDLSV